MNEDKDTTFDLKDTDYDDDDYKGDIKSKDYEEDKPQKEETIQNSRSPSAPSPESFGKVKTDFWQSSADFQQSSTDFQQSSTNFQAGGSAETQTSDWRPGTATLAWAPGNLTPVVP